MTCDELMQTLVDNYDPAKADGVDAIIQFNLTGEADCTFWLRISGATCEAQSGVAENPRMTLRANTNEFIAVLKGDIPPMTAFIQGKIKIQGDTFLAMKLQSLLA